MSSPRHHSHSPTPSQHTDTATEEVHDASAATSGLAEDPSPLAEGDPDVSALSDDDFGSEDTPYADPSEPLVREHITTLTTRWNDFKTFMEQWFERERRRINELPRHEMVDHASTVMENKSDDELPQAVCYRIVDDLGDFWEITDQEGCNRAHKAVIQILSPLFVFNQMPEEDVPITTNLKRLQEQAFPWRDYDTMVTTCSLAEQLASVAEAANDHAATYWPYLSDDQASNDLKQTFSTAVNLVVDAQDAALNLTASLRAPHQSISLPQDWIDRDHPACLLLLRAHVRRMQGFSQLGAHRVLNDHEAVLHQELDQISGTSLYDDIYACLQPGAPVDAPSLSRARSTISSAPALARPRSLLVALDALADQHAVWDSIKSENALTADAHQDRETEPTLRTILSGSMAETRSQLPATSTLPPPTRRALHKAISTHNFAAALSLLHQQAAPAALPALTATYLDQKTPTLLQHLDPTSPYRICCLTDSSAVALTRLFAFGAHALRAGSAYTLPQRVTAVTWLCALVDAWFAWLGEMQGIVRGVAATEWDTWEWEVVVEELRRVGRGEGAREVERMGRVVGNLEHVTDVFVGCGMGVDEGVGEGGMEGREGVRAAYREMRRFVVWPGEGERGVLEGGGVRVVGEVLERWV